MSQPLRNLSDISFPLTRQGRTLIDAEGVEICTVTKENISPVAGDELAALVCRLLNDDAVQKMMREEEDLEMARRKERDLKRLRG